MYARIVSLMETQQPNTPSRQPRPFITKAQRAAIEREPIVLNEDLRTVRKELREKEREKRERVPRMEAIEEDPVEFGPPTREQVAVQDYWAELAERNAARARKAAARMERITISEEETHDLLDGDRMEEYDILEFKDPEVSTVVTNLYSADDDVIDTDETDLHNQEYVTYEDWREQLMLKSLLPKKMDLWLRFARGGILKENIPGAKLQAFTVTVANTADVDIINDIVMTQFITRQYTTEIERAQLHVPNDYPPGYTHFATLLEQSGGLDSAYLILRENINYMDYTMNRPSAMRIAQLDERVEADEGVMSVSSFVYPSFIKCIKYENEYEGPFCMARLCRYMRRNFLIDHCTQLRLRKMVRPNMPGTCIAKLLTKFHISHTLMTRTGVISNRCFDAKVKPIHLLSTNNHVYVTEKPMSIEKMKTVKVDEAEMMRLKISAKGTMVNLINGGIVLNQVIYESFNGHERDITDAKLTSAVTRINAEWYQSNGIRARTYCNGIHPDYVFDRNNCYPSIMEDHQLPNGTNGRIIDVDDGSEFNRLTLSSYDFVFFDFKQSCPETVKIVMAGGRTTDIWCLWGVLEAVRALGYDVVDNIKQIYRCDEGTVKSKLKGIDKGVMCRLSGVIEGQTKKDERFYSHSNVIDGCSIATEKMLIPGGGKDRKDGASMVPGRSVIHSKYKLKTGQVAKAAIYCWAHFELLKMAHVVGINKIPVYCRTDSIGYTGKDKVSDAHLKLVNFKREYKPHEAFNSSGQVSTKVVFKETVKLDSLKELVDLGSHDKDGLPTGLRLVVGAAGTGKTTSVKKLANCLVVCSTKNFAEASGTVCLQTLMKGHIGEVRKTIDNRLLVVDECFLLSQYDIVNIMRITKGNVIFVGDPNQLLGREGNNELFPAYTYEQPYTPGKSRFSDSTVMEMSKMILPHINDKVFTKEMIAELKRIMKHLTLGNRGRVDLLLGYRKRVLNTICDEYDMREWTTVHSAQGKTITEPFAICDWSTTTPRLLYTAITRARTLKDVYDCE